MWRSCTTTRGRSTGSRGGAKDRYEPAGKPQLSSSGEVSTTSPHCCEQMGSANRGCATQGFVGSINERSRVEVLGSEGPWVSMRSRLEARVRDDGRRGFPKWTEAEGLTAGAAHNQRGKKVD